MEGESMRFIVEDKVFATLPTACFGRGGGAGN